MTPRAPRIPVSTYSIVARDPATGEVGCAVQSHFFSVGPLVPWVEAGVGAVATQAMVEPSYGPRGLERMRDGDSAPDALAALLEEDARREVRQVAMIDVSGRVATHTGAKCIAEAGHRQGDRWSVQANMMRASTVPDAMARAFEEADGDLADRMLAALVAAENEGGDIRGKQSAAIVVMKGTGTGRTWHDRCFDLRVEDHAEPLDELARLVRMQRAYDFVERGDACLAARDMNGARDAFRRAAELAPEAGELAFWQAVALFAAGDRDEALRRFGRLFEREPVWRDLVPRLVDPGILPDHDAVRRILEAGR